MVGDPTASTGTDLSIITSGTGALTFETGSFTTLNLWSGDGLGDNTGTLTAADLLIVGGNVNLGGTLQVLNPNGMTGWNEGDVWKLFDWSGLTTPLVAGNEFEALDLPDISGSGYAWDLTDLYIGGTITVAPEPSRLMLLAFGLLVLTGRRRRI